MLIRTNDSVTTQTQIHKLDLHESTNTKYEKWSVGEVFSSSRKRFFLVNVFISILGNFFDPTPPKYLKYANIYRIFFTESWNINCV
jgi:hypothetical protein